MNESESKENNGNPEELSDKKQGRSNWCGRKSFDDYNEAETHHLKVESAQSGDACPCCNRGRLYESEEQKLLEFTGNCPVSVTRYRKQILRCNACSITVSNNKNITKWTNSSRSSIVLQKTHGMPFHRLSKLQGLSGVPISFSTLWKQCFDLWEEIGCHIYGELLGLIAECDYFNVDDTGAKILEVIKENKILQHESDGKKKGRKCNTTTVCATTKNNEKLVLYITKNTHGGENIGQILTERKNKTGTIYLMVDASSSNKPVLNDQDKWLLNNVIIINCLAHGQRKFTDIEEYYEEECGYFLKQTRGIYHNEHWCKEYSLEDKLKYHQEHSAIFVENIYNKIESLFSNKITEPNSTLGKAMKYWINNKVGLTQFLNIGLLSLDNNLAERSLKAIILQRKNSLFFKTKDSAEVHSGLHSIVKTCDANGINAFKYLNWIQDHWVEARKNAMGYTPFAYARYMKDTELIGQAA